MTPEHKKILRALVLELRTEFEGNDDSAGTWQPGDLERRLVELGVRRDREPLPIDELPGHVDLEVRRTVDAYLGLRLTAALDVKTAEEARRALLRRGRVKPSETTEPKLTAAEKAAVIHDGVAEFIRESAYTWANRLLALRCLEARGLTATLVLLAAAAMARGVGADLGAGSGGRVLHRSITTGRNRSSAAFSAARCARACAGGRRRAGRPGTW